jgi:CBS domain-containing protein
MTTARDVMTADPTTIGETDSLIDAAPIMRDLNVGALPICGEDGRLKGLRRLPVIEDLQLVGIIAQADIALSLSATETGETVEAISE